MSKSPKRRPAQHESGKTYRAALHALQVELVKVQRHVIEHGHRVLVIFEGRDAAGKDGTIKRIVQHLSPRETRVVALGKPSDRDRASWYFQRYVPYLPSAQEMILFNRSWYNRAGVEPVMHFCSSKEAEAFLRSAPEFERMLARSGITLLKYYLDISKREQARRLQERRQDPLKQWKLSPVDQAAQAHWREYSRARNAMLTRTHHEEGPWIVVRADHKHAARLNVIRDILARVPYAGARKSADPVDPTVAQEFHGKLITSGWLAK